MTQPLIFMEILKITDWINSPKFKIIRVREDGEPSLVERLSDGIYFGVGEVVRLHTSKVNKNKNILILSFMPDLCTIQTYTSEFANHSHVEGTGYASINDIITQ